MPPQIGGGPELLLVSVALQPPVKLVLANQSLNAASTADCVKQAATVVSLAQVSITGESVTVKLALQVTGSPQSLTTVKVTVTDPPHSEGAPILLLDIDALQPPLKLAVINHASNAASTSA